MATVRNGVAAGSTTNAATYTTASFTPTSGDLLFAIFGVSGSTATDWAPSDSLSGSWQKILRAVKGGSADFVEVWVRTALSNGSALTVTFSHASGNASGCAWNVSRVAGMSLTGSSAIRGSGIEDNLASGATPAPTLSTAALTGNPTVTGVFSTVNGGLNTVPTNWTALSHGNHGTPNATVRQAYRNSGFTGTTITWGSTVAATHCSWAVEFDTSTSTPHSHSQPDTLAGTDAQTKAAGKTHADTLTGTDSVTRAWAATSTPQDTATATDARTATAGKTLADTAAVTDSVTPLLILTQRIDDSITGTDTVTKATGSTLADSLTATDSTAKAPATTVADTLVGTDAQTRAWAAELALADTGALTDANQRETSGANNWTHTVNDSITATDTTTTVHAALRTIGDTVVVTDTHGNAVGITLADTTTSTDTLTPAWAATRTHADSVTATDTITLPAAAPIPRWDTDPMGHWPASTIPRWGTAAGNRWPPHTNDPWP